MLHRPQGIETSVKPRANRISACFPKLPPIIAAAILSGSLAGTASAQQKPGDADLASIIEQLTSHHREGSRVEFVDRNATMSLACRMTAAAMKVSRGNDARTFPVLIEDHGGRSGVRQMFAKLGRITVDADGAGRAYHPEDPFGECSESPDRPLSHVCALDNFPMAACGCLKARCG